MPSALNQDELIIRANLMQRGRVLGAVPRFHDPVTCPLWRGGSALRCICH